MKEILCKPNYYLGLIKNLILLGIIILKDYGNVICH